MSHENEQKKIAVNTVFLYLRMFIVMAVSFYTSRVVLDKLGVDDYGIYNIVGSVVVSFAFVRNALQSATQRFLSYSKGSERGQVSTVFSMSLNIQVLIMLVVFILLESVGVLVLNNVIQIPADRFDAAKVVYQLSAITFCVSILQVPYNSLIISNEKMSIYAFFSIIEVLLKLVIVYALSVSESIDKLILYGALMLCVTIIHVLMTVGYCRIKLADDSRYSFHWDKSLFKEILAFSTWNLVGGVSGIASSEGPNYFMNYYLGVGVNAAMGIAKQVSNAVYGFSSNFQNAFNPQIVKAYASKDREYLFTLVFRTSKLSFFLLYVLALPLIICCKEILSIWLTIVPEYTLEFCVCILISQLVAAVSSPFWMAAHAIGNIKKYQLYISMFSISIIPVSWILLAQNIPPYWIIVYLILSNIMILIYRVSYLRKKIDFPAVKYYADIVLRCMVLIPLITIPLTMYVHSLFESWIGIIVTSAFSLLFNVASIYTLALTKGEKEYIIGILKNKLKLQ